MWTKGVEPGIGGSGGRPPGKHSDEIEQILRATLSEAWKRL